MVSFFTCESISIWCRRRDDPGVTRMSTASLQASYPSFLAALCGERAPQVQILNLTQFLCLFYRCHYHLVFLGWYIREIHIFVSSSPKLGKRGSGAVFCRMWKSLIQRKWIFKKEQRKYDWNGSCRLLVQTHKLNFLMSPLCQLDSQAGLQMRRQNRILRMQWLHWWVLGLQRQQTL